MHLPILWKQSVSWVSIHVETIKNVVDVTTQWLSGVQSAPLPAKEGVNAPALQEVQARAGAESYLG